MSTPAIPVPPVTVRPPWPDELPRLTDAFPALGWRQPMELRVLATTLPPERLVGIAALRLPGKKDDPLTLLLVVRPRFANATELAQLATALLSCADPAREIVFPAARTLPPALHTALEQAGLRPDPASEHPRWLRSARP